jgi:hypothetical protein
MSAMGIDAHAHARRTASGFRRSRSRSSSMSWSVGEFLFKVSCNIPASRHPDTLFCLNVFHEIAQCFRSPWLSNDTTAPVSERKVDFGSEYTYLCMGMFIIFPPSRYSISNVAFKYSSYMWLPTKPGLMWNLPSEESIG